ncbi:L-threonylcarbamoyladenylate synthase [Mycoplasmatota bacterium WC44]
MEKITLKELGKIDLNGKIISFPTDTVYGVGALISDEEGIDKIYELKQRDYSKPLAVLVSNKEELKNLVEDESLLDKVDKFWPGAITFILKKKNVLDKVTSGFDTVGVRIPNSKVALEVLKNFGPMAVTSVNISGEDSKLDLEGVTEFNIDYVITDKETSLDISSTVVDISTDTPIVLREGAITYLELQKEFPNIRK